MLRKDRLLTALILLVAILCLAANGSAFVDEPAALTEAPAEQDAGIQTLGAAIQNSHEPAELTADDNYAPLYINGVLAADCLVLGGVSLMSLGRFAQLAGLSWDGRAIGGLVPELADEECAVVNGRYFYLPGGLTELGGEQLWPLRELARMFSCTVSWDAESGSINLDVTGLALPESGETYYDSEDVYWLSRIIYAESGNQPLAGQIGVGAVVLNRVESPLFPDTVYDVIFDRSCGVQFSPVESGAIYMQPDGEAVIAAYLSLEGYNTVGESLYFVNPEIGGGYWFAANLTWVATIGDHDFYA